MKNWINSATFTEQDRVMEKGGRFISKLDERIYYYYSNHNERGLQAPVTRLKRVLLFLSFFVPSSRLEGVSKCSRVCMHM
jgi:hypothetical protein